MILLLTYISVALGFSFFCSIAEAVLLSVTSSYIALLQKEGKIKIAQNLEKLKNDVNQPLAAILTLNTIAHTAGAAGAGAQASKVFGDEVLGLFSAILTLLILVFSEIIPKTLGANYWKNLAPITAISLKYLVIILWPFVKLSSLITNRFSYGQPTLKGFNREELAAMAEISEREGQIEPREHKVIHNLLRFGELRVRDVTTPRTVVFSVDATLTVAEYFELYSEERFSRIPAYKGKENQERMEGFILRSDLLLARANGDLDKTVMDFLRAIPALPETLPLSLAMETFLQNRHQIAAVIDEHGGLEGIVTLEDMIEKLIGEDIIDEGDKVTNMQRFARYLAKRKRKQIN